MRLHKCKNRSKDEEKFAPNTNVIYSELILHKYLILQLVKYKKKTGNKTRRCDKRSQTHCHLFNKYSEGEKKKATQKASHICNFFHGREQGGGFFHQVKNYPWTLTGKYWRHMHQKMKASLAEESSLFIMETVKLSPIFFFSVTSQKPCGTQNTKCFIIHTTEVLSKGELQILLWEGGWCPNSWTLLHIQVWKALANVYFIRLYDEICRVGCGGGRR